MHLDISEALAALTEDGEGHTIEAFGETFKVPPSMPPFFALYIFSAESATAFTALLGADQLKKLARHQPNNQQLAKFIDGVFRLYGGGDEGKSTGPVEPSEATGEPSTPTSEGTTEST